MKPLRIQISWKIFDVSITFEKYILKYSTIFKLIKEAIKGLPAKQTDIVFELRNHRHFQFRNNL